MAPSRSVSLRRRSGALLGVVALLLSPVVGSGPLHADDAKPKPAAGQIYALLIGCTEYPELKKVVSPIRYEAKVRLAGCLNDVQLMRTTLIERFGVPEANITALAGWGTNPATRPTGANVHAAFRALAARTYAPGDRVIVHYSGHGVQQPDEDHEEVDGWDEAWLVADARKDPKTVFAGTLRDEVIGGYLRAIRDRGARVWCIMDCCHAATGTRGVNTDGGRTRGLQASVLGLDPKPGATRGLADAHEESPMAEATKGSENITVFYAAQSFQEVPELKLPTPGAGSKSYGLLTTAVVRALHRSGERLTFAELYEQVVAGYRDLGKHHIVQPLAEGDLAALVFGGTQGLGVPLFLHKTGPRSLALGAGALHGISKGTELDVFAPGQGGKPEAKLGRVVVHAVSAESSAARPVKGSNDAWARTGKGPWPTEIAQYVIGDTSLPLAFVDEQGKRVKRATLSKAVRAVLDEPRMKVRFPPAPSLSDAAWVIVVGQGGRLLALRPAVRGPAAQDFTIDAGSLESTLLTVFRGENLLRLTGRDPRMGRLPANLTLQVSRRRADGTSVPVLAGQRISPGTVLDLGLVKEEALRRRDVETVDVFVFWIDPHYGISMLYPTEASGPRLGEDDVATKNKPIRLGYADGELISDESQGPERIVVFASPKRDDKTHLRLEFLEQPPLKLRTRGSGGSKRTGVAGMLEELAFGGDTTRGRVRRVDRGAITLFMQVLTFETRWGPIRIPQASKDQVSTRIEAPAPATADGAPRSAWSFQGAVHLAKAGSPGTHCMLVARETNAAHVLIDLDGEVPADQRDADGLKRMVSEKTFDAEIAIRIENNPKRTTVWYDTDDDGIFDTVYIDADGNHRAEERYRRTKAGWKHTHGLDKALLSTGHLTWIADNVDVRIEAVSRLYTLAGDP